MSHAKRLHTLQQFNVLLGRWKAKFGNADICTTFGVPRELSHAVMAIQRLILEAKPGNLNRDKRVNFLQALDDFEAEMRKPDKSSHDLVSTRPLAVYSYLN